MQDVRPSSRKETRTIGGCRLLRELSANGKECVYLAEQVRLGGRLVAVKTIAVGDDDSEEPCQAAEARRSHEYEAETLGRFTHPHILPIHDSGYDRGQFYLVTHYAAGGTLADTLGGADRGLLEAPLATSLAVDLVTQIASALQHIHDRGFVHNDVQPCNILIDASPYHPWRVLLTGFDRVTRLDTTSESPHACDNMAYIAPERFNGQATPATDQYALAALASRLLTRRTPCAFLAGASVGATRPLEPQPPSQLNLKFSTREQVEAVIARGLAKEPSERYPSVTAFARALRLAAQEPDETPTIWLALDETAHAASNSEPATFILRATPVVYDEASEPVTEPGKTRPAPVLPRPERPHIPVNAQAAPAPHPAREGRVLAVGLASLLLLLAVAITSPGVLPLASSQGGKLARSLANWGSRSHTQTVSYGHVNAPPTAPTVQSNDGDTQRPDVISNDRAAPLPRTLAVAATPGKQIAARFSFANNGDTSWSHAKGYALTCASQRHRNATCLGFTPIGFGGYAVPPGGRFTFTVRLTVPPQSGSYSIWLNVGRNGQLFHSQDLLLTVTT